ncbi:hypothetical protein [Streptomyces sp. NPDC089915]|uniref:hypothetical protein n=1 Tax=Streptomyces sp. NPDC089915 TaxID=3155186 RepID=UPI00343648EF
MTQRLDPGTGWYGEFLRRDPEGMRACLDGIAVPPWDVLESLLADLPPGAGAGEEAAYAAGLRAAAVAAWDARPGGARELRTLLVTASGQLAAVEEALAALAARLGATADPARAEALSRELAWTRDDALRARSRHTDLRSRLAALRPLPAVPRQRDPLLPTAPAGHLPAGPAGSGVGPAVGSGPGSGPGSGVGPGMASGPGHGMGSGVGPGPGSGVASGPGHGMGPEVGHGMGPEVASGSGPAMGFGPGHGVGPEMGFGPDSGVGSGPGVPGAVDPELVRRGYPDAWYGASAEGLAVEAAEPRGPGGSAEPGGRTGPGGAEPGPGGAVPRGVARGAFVAELLTLRARGHSGEAHALLCEAALWPAGELPGLAAELAHAGLAADWDTLLWETAALPPGRLAEAAAALADAGRRADSDRLLRQGVARPAAQVAETALALGGAGRDRETGALLEAFVRLRTADETAALARHDPHWFTPRLLRAARALSAARHRDLSHTLRVSGLPVA